MSKQNVYDDKVFFENFQSSRSNDVNFNDCIETPILFGMLPDLHGKKVLDIGCGMGQHARQYSEMGAESVLGIDLSEKCCSMPESIIAVIISSISGWPWKILIQSAKHLTL